MPGKLNHNFLGGAEQVFFFFFQISQVIQRVAEVESYHSTQIVINDSQPLHSSLQSITQAAGNPASRRNSVCAQDKLFSPRTPGRMITLLIFCVYVYVYVVCAYLFTCVCAHAHAFVQLWRHDVDAESLPCLCYNLFTEAEFAAEPGVLGHS